MGKNKKNTQNTGGVAPPEEDTQDVGGIAPPTEEDTQGTGGVAQPAEEDTQGTGGVVPPAEEGTRKSVRVTIRSLTGATYRRAGIEFDAVTPRTVSLSVSQLPAIRADKNLEVSEG